MRMNSNLAPCNSSMSADREIYGLGLGSALACNSYEVRRRPIVRRERGRRCNQQGARNEKFVELIANRRGDLNLAKESGMGRLFASRR